MGPIFNFTGVSFYQNTLSLSTPSVATGVNFLDILTTNGSTPFSVVYNNVTYSGSVNVVGKKATFTWPYTSGVVISPLVISQ